MARRLLFFFSLLRKVCYRWNPKPLEFDFSPEEPLNLIWMCSHLTHITHITWNLFAIYYPKLQYSIYSYHNLAGGVRYSWCVLNDFIENCDQIWSGFFQNRSNVLSIVTKTNRNHRHNALILPQTTVLYISILYIQQMGFLSLTFWYLKRTRFGNTNTNTHTTNLWAMNMAQKCGECMRSLSMFLARRVSPQQHKIYRTFHTNVYTRYTDRERDTLCIIQIPTSKKANINGNFIIAIIIK